MENLNNIKIYPKCTVYKLVGVDINDCNKIYIYIGSTVNPISNRKSQHKYHYKLYKNKQMTYCASFELFNNCNDIKIEPLEIIENITREKLREVENKYIIDSECINKIRAHNDTEYKKEYGRIMSKDYYHKHRDVELAKKKNYYHNNKDKFKARYEKNKEEYLNKYTRTPEAIERLKQYREANKQKAKEWREKNKDKLKQWREDNRDKLKAYAEKRKLKKLQENYADH